MLIEFDEIAVYMGRLYAAALHDIGQAAPGDVDLTGTSIVRWREAYLEGIKDMGQGILTRVPIEHRDAALKAVHAARDLETKELTSPADAPEQS